MTMRLAFCVAGLALLTALAWGALAPARAEGGDTASWTVLIYMCGSDLESEGGLATANLEEISRSSPFPDISPADVPRESAVNLLIETGGCLQWQTGKRLGFDIAADKLQRYRYEPGLTQPFVLEREEPLARMSDPATLADFIRWGAREYPAKRYALVLWGHGGGSHTGLLPDECYDGRYMNIAELEQALSDGGLRFDTLIMDACMMANLETALAVRDHADWLVASEEIAAGSGTAYDVWLNGLYAWPECNGYRLGRTVCDSVQKKCADLGDEQAKSILTFSLVDTSKVDAAAAQFDRFWEYVSRLYEQEPRWFGFLCSVIGQTESYGTASDHMMDIGAMLTQPYSAALIDGDVRAGLAEALMEAVPYMVKGSGRSEANGLSFCYGPAMSPEELDIYAGNCKSAAYLALLDAVNADWTAPEWVYDGAQRLAGIEDRDCYSLRFSIVRDGDGMPVLTVSDPLETISGCNYLLYRVDEDSGELLKLGQSVCEVTGEDETEAEFKMNLAQTWPAINGEICDLELVKHTNSYYLYNIPMLVLDTRYDLRVAYVLDREQDFSRRAWYLGILEMTDYRLNALDEAGKYEVYGFWKGYDDNSLNASRDTTSPALLEGREYHLLYPIQERSLSGETYYQLGALKQMPGILDIDMVPLPPGRYAAEFLLKDIFGRTFGTDAVDLIWNGTDWSLAQ